MLNRTMILFLASLFSTAIFAHDISNEHYKTMSVDGKNSYDINLKSNSFEWKGITGVDKGKSELSPSTHTHLTDAVEVIQWRGKKEHSFNTLIIDENNLKYVYSSVNKHETILDSGTLERM